MIEIILDNPLKYRLKNVVTSTNSLPVTVMVNSQEPSFSAVSLTLHVTVVRPSVYKSADITTLPRQSVHTIVLLSMVSTLSVPLGNGDQVTLAVDSPWSMDTELLLGQSTVGASVSA